MTDAVPLGKFKMTADGYLTAVPRVARVGIQTYKGIELGRPDLGNPCVSAWAVKYLSAMRWKVSLAYTRHLSASARRNGGRFKLEAPRRRRDG